MSKYTADKLKTKSFWCNDYLIIEENNLHFRKVLPVEIVIRLR